MTFFALPIPTSQQSRIAEGFAPFQRQWPAVQWVHPEDYHLTLRFIGGLPPDELAHLLAVVQRQRLNWTPFTMDLKGLCCFPPRRDRGVLWIGVDPIPGELRDLQEHLEAQVQSLGFPPERRPFTPHLTVGRFQGADAPSIMDALPAQTDRLWGRLTWDEYVLMKRRSGARGLTSPPAYEVLARFPVESYAGASRV
ncbi:MAG: RNA 2',3'-cyclic phosphodiesterase [Pseudobdellovibrionaceae bacterium]|nr:RNA 2',3'-cyclic phosphodiesterase [Pseudobdellovibrionaceae bacterium]